MFSPAEYTVRRLRAPGTLYAFARHDTFDECLVDCQLCRLCGQLLHSPPFDLWHWIEVPLHSVHANGERALEREVPRLIYQDRSVDSTDYHGLRFRRQWATC